MIHLGLLNSIEQKFLVSGHSFLDCDRDFALIEKKKRRTILFEPKDVSEVIRKSRQVPFKVVKMQKFYDFKDGAEMLLNTTKLAISTAVWIKITTPGIVELKRDFDDAPFERFNVWKRGNALFIFSCTHNM